MAKRPKKKPAVTVRVTGVCTLFATIEMRCPLCDVIVPAGTPHSCKRLEEK